MTIVRGLLIGFVLLGNPSYASKDPMSFARCHRSSRQLTSSQNYLKDKKRLEMIEEIIIDLEHIKANKHPDSIPRAYVRSCRTKKKKTLKNLISEASQHTYTSKKWNKLIARAYRLQNNKEKAHEHYTKETQISQDDLKTKEKVFHLGVDLFAHKKDPDDKLRFDSSFESLTATANNSREPLSNRVSSHHLLAKFYIGQDKHEKALHHMQAIAKLDSHDTASREYIARYKVERSLYLDAQKEIDELLVIAPKHAWALKQKIIFYMQYNRFDHAQDLIARSKKRSVSDQEFTLLAKAVEAWQEDRKQLGSDSMKFTGAPSAKNISQKLADLYEEKGNKFLKKREFTLAMFYYQRAFQFSVKGPENDRLRLKIAAFLYLHNKARNFSPRSVAKADLGYAMNLINPIAKKIKHPDYLQFFVHAAQFMGRTHTLAALCKQSRKYISKSNLNRKTASACR